MANHSNDTKSPKSSINDIELSHQQMSEKSLEASMAADTVEEVQQKNVSKVSKKKELQKIVKPAKKASNLVPFSKKNLQIEIDEQPIVEKLPHPIRPTSKVDMDSIS